MIAAPGLTGGRTIDLLLQPPDILPTLLELAGIEVETPEPLHGKSFAPALRGESLAPLHDCVVSGSYWQPEESPGKQVTPVMYTTRWAYVPVGQAGKPELYDLVVDPGAERDMAPIYPEQVTELDEQYKGWLRRYEA
jgi:arylsulfatase A-like enzyme